MGINPGSRKTPLLRISHTYNYARSVLRLYLFVILVFCKTYEVESYCVRMICAKIYDERSRKGLEVKMSSFSFREKMHSLAIIDFFYWESKVAICRFQICKNDFKFET